MKTMRWHPPGYGGWFLPGDIRMLAGEARNIASDRAKFLGVHPGRDPPRNA
ncbi:hypothetical protein [Rhizorhabdus sp.]|uniref:hypothetical protein n=1 Tax=Rhizorhabdus sp. TaxID=1968843 RepID=UPI0019C105FD|nr:hypothetical protein [Rhizorhabdus sp.]MBD3763061.1 hypothetical protein [Rhizorhabdus sp.]